MPNRTDVYLRARRVPWRIVVPVALYLLLSLLGMSQSSIGIDTLREDPQHPHGLMWGDAQGIRSDEWRTASPFMIGAMATGSSDELNPLAADQAFLTHLQSGPVSSVVLLDATVSEIEFLPDEMVFAARWWLPFLLLALGAPAFFRNLTGSRYIGWFAAALIAFSPSSAWWSFGSLDIIATALAGAAALQNCACRTAEGRRAAALAWGVLSAVVLARSAVAYAPWVVILSSAVLLTAVVALTFDRRSWRSLFAVVGGVGTLTLALCAGVFLENREALDAVTNTVYPGDRSATGYAVPFQLLFGATNEGQLSEFSGLTGTNQSEISSSFTVVFIWVLFLLTRRLPYRTPGHRAAVTTLAVISTCWLSWSMVSWDRLGLHVPLVNQVAPERAAQVVGLLGIVLLCLVLPACPDRGSARIGGIAAVASALAAASAGSLLVAQNAYPISTRSIWIAAALLASVVFFISWRPRLWTGYAAAGLLALSLVVTVNPVLFGLGDLRDSDAAKMMLAAGDEARESGTAWVSDSGDVDSLMIATGVPALSGRQVAGPDVDAWEQLSPSEGSAGIWNRGGSYVYFGWNNKKELEIANPNADVITVIGSPCTVAERVPQLSHLVASKPLDQPCLTQVDEFTWAGAPRWVYEVD